MAVLHTEDASWPGRPSRRSLVSEESRRDGVVHVSGQIYLDTLTEWERILAGLFQREGDVHMDLSEVTFVDVAGATALAGRAQRLPRDRRIVIHHPPASLSRVLELFWPDLVAIEVVK
ncbi:STAS domain-containing protein [Streptomyces sp. NPDC049837]|uniref:STAS domain-containing protein n=1 Tax=Streptomyces sp. NPDC049837 TaxID=3155277 RepID=UPI0034474399